MEIDTNQQYNHFLHILKEQPWEVMNNIFKITDVPINFLLKEDTQKGTAFHLLADPPTEKGT